jgi:hypothetical protein
MTFIVRLKDVSDRGFLRHGTRMQEGKLNLCNFDQDISIFLSTDTDTEAAQSAIYSGERVETE